MRRLLFVHYDRDGLVDPHVRHLFAALAADCGDSWFIHNGEAAPGALAAVEPIAGRVIVRPNRGFDFGAWGEVITEHAAEVLACDELVLANSSCYGPLFPLAPYWAKMADVPCDIWGMTRHHGVRGLPEHLQSYFLVIRRPVLESAAFRDFWRGAASSCGTMAAAVRRGEIEFSERMRAAGFRLAACIEPEDRRENLRVGIAESFCVNNADWLIGDYRLPLLKVKAFERVPDTPVRRGGAIFAALRRSGSDYPAELITNHLRRTAPLSWQLDLPETLLTEPAEMPSAPPLKIAVMMHIYYPEMLDELLLYAGRLPADFDLIVTTPHEGVAERIENSPFRPARAKSIRVIPVPNRGRDISPWLSALPPEEHLAYDVVLKLHTKGAPNQPAAFGAEWRRWTLENLAGSAELAGAVLAAFAAEPKLGAVLPPYPPVVTEQCPEAASGSPADAALAADLLTRLGLNTPPEPERPVFGVGTMFYYRPAALAPLFKLGLKAEDFPPEPLPWRGTLAHAVERLPVRVAQGAGYYFRQSVMRGSLAEGFRRYECAALYPDRTIRPALAALKRAVLHSLRVRLGRFKG